MNNFPDDCKASYSTSAKRICAITTAEPYLQLAVQRLGKQYLLPTIDIREQENFDFILLLTAQGLILQDTDSKGLGTLQIDFLKGKIGYRLRHLQAQKQLLAKAIGTKTRANTKILDLTAGLGNDSFVLAQLGFSVTLLERSPIIAALLDDGLRRALNDKKYSPLTIHVIHTDASVYLSQIYSQQLDFQQSAERISDFPLYKIHEDCKLSDNTAENTSAKRRIQAKTTPDIIYLDPMYPHSNKSALAKKEMCFLRKIVGNDTDAEILLPFAIKLAQQRVIVKRARLAAFLAGLPPHHSIFGKQHRFDIYLTNPQR